jgi:hypothetical protein
VDQLEALLAERDIARQIVRFGRAMDDRDWAALRGILFDDATADLGTGPLRGSDAIIDLIRSFLSACGTTQHFVGSMLVDVDGDGETATSKAYVRDLHLGTGPREHLAFSTLGDYHDRWERDGSTWRIRERTKLNRAQVGTLEVFGIDDPSVASASGRASPSHLEILNIVYRYPELIDAGDFSGVGELLSDATLVFQAADGSTIGEAVGPDAITASFDTVRVYADDGTPHTRHVITNPIVSIDDESGTATCRYYITVFQRTDDFPLQPVWANRYEDRFERRDGQWRIVRRRGFSHLPGDTSHHLSYTPDV